MIKIVLFSLCFLFTNTSSNFVYAADGLEISDVSSLFAKIAPRFYGEQWREIPSSDSEERFFISRKEYMDGSVDMITLFKDRGISVCDWEGYFEGAREGDPFKQIGYKSLELYKSFIKDLQKNNGFDASH